MKAAVTATVIVMLTGCATSVPVTARFPAPPGLTAMTACPDLAKVPADARLSDIAKIVAQNYTTYYECAVKTDAWIEWYNSQRKIFEQAGK